MGNKHIKIRGVKVDEFNLGEVAKFDVFIENMWNQLLKDVYGELIILDKDFFERNKISPQDLDNKFEYIINNVNTNAPVKIISINKTEDEIVGMFKDIIVEIKKIDLREKIENLENKVSASLDESSYSELLSLRNQLKEG